MAIDEHLKSIQVKDTNLAFEELKKQAEDIFQKETGYTGDLSNVELLNSHFQTYEVSPVLENQIVVGVKIQYSLKSSEVESVSKNQTAAGANTQSDLKSSKVDGSRKSRPASGCTNSTNYRFG